MQQINIDQVRDLESKVASLYDIKTLAQAIGGKENKGWACLSKDIPSVFGTGSTVYKDIKEKYDNTETESSDWTNKKLNNSNNAYVYLREENGDKYIYFSSNGRIYKIKKENIDNINLAEEYLNASIYSMVFYIGQNIDIVQDTQWGKINIYNKQHTLLESITAASTGEQNLTIFTWNNKKYVEMPCQENSYIISDETNYEKILAPSLNSFGWYPVNNVRVCNNNVYFSRQDRIYKVENLEDISDTTKWQQLTQDSQQFYGAYGLCVINNILFASRWTSSTNGISYSTDFGATWTNMSMPASNQKYYLNQNENGTEIIARARNSSDVYIIRGINNIELIRSTTDIQRVDLNSFACQYILENDLMVFSNNANNDYSYTYSGLVKKAYTDTYQIGDNTRTITYYKGSNNEKITLDNTYSDEITTALGYYPYFYLNIGNGLTLPRNKNLWTMMYVGDDFVDSNLPSGNATVFASKVDLTEKQDTAEVITDTTSTSKSFSSSDKLKANADYQLGTLTALSFGANSVDDSQLGTTIKFTSGSTATTITDSAGITWADGEAPAPSASKTCLILIWNKTGFYKEW